MLCLHAACTFLETQCNAHMMCLYAMHILYNFTTLAAGYLNTYACVYIYLPLAGLVADCLCLINLSALFQLPSL